MYSGVKKHAGFSLIELIIAIAILVILTGVLAPQFIKYIEKSRKTKIMQTLDTIYVALEASYIDVTEAGIQPGESIFILPGDGNRGTDFERALYHSLEEKLNSGEMEKIEIEIKPEGGEDDIANLNNVIIRYYKSEADHTQRLLYYYFRHGAEQQASNFPGTYGETVTAEGGKSEAIQWK